MPNTVSRNGMESNDDDFIHRNVEICKHCEYFFKGILRNNTPFYCCDRQSDGQEDSEIYERWEFEAFKIPDDCEMKAEYCLMEWNPKKPDDHAEH